ncbi:MAG: hypothetical protein M1830_004519, partial [Pleopsidium flavum]
RSGGQGDINRTGVHPQDPLKWVGGLTSLPEHGRSRRLEEALVLTESVFDSHSTLLLISVPLALWTFTPDNPAYSFVGFITSKNRVTGRELSRSNSMSALTKVAAEIDRQHWWYKWYLGLAIFTVFPAFWQVLPQRGAESLLSFFLLLGGVMATSFGLLTLADSSVTPLMNGSLSESSRQGAIY